jgi:hypothetical protein
MVQRAILSALPRNGPGGESGYPNGAVMPPRLPKANQQLEEGPDRGCDY